MRYPTTPFKGLSAERLNWMSGKWVGKKDAEQIEEHWSDAAANTMVGMFRWIKEDNVWFYELLAIEPEDDQLVMRIKHFYPGFKGWEEKDESIAFVLVSVDIEEAVFLQKNKPEPVWLVYRLEGSNNLVTYFVQKGKPIHNEDKFVFEKIE